MKDDELSGFYDILLLDFMIYGLRMDKKNMFFFFGVKIFYLKGFKGKKFVWFGYVEVFCNWILSEFELILNRCLFYFF